MDSTRSAARSEMSEPTTSAKIRKVQRAAFCALHGWNLSMEDIGKHGCQNPKKQHGKPECYHLVKDANNVVWFRRWIKEQRKKNQKREKKALHRISKADDEEEQW